MAKDKKRNGLIDLDGNMKVQEINCILTNAFRYRK